MRSRHSRAAAATATAIACCTLLISSVASADWYSGDPYAANTAWPQYTDNLSDAYQNRAMTFDNFTWVPGTGAGVIDRVGGHFHSFGPDNSTMYDTAYWEIRTGLAHNVAGTLIASGSGIVTGSATSFTQGGAAVWRTDVDVPDFALPAGNYWFGLAIGVSSGPPYGAFVASTSGANGIGGPLGDDVSIYYQINGATVSWNYVDSYTVNAPTVTTGFDPSYYITEVPEPASLGCIACAGLLAARRVRRTTRVIR